MTESAMSEPASRVLAALAWMGGALLSFSMVAIAGRQASLGGSTLEIMFYRGLMSLAIVSGFVVALRPGLDAMRTARLPLHAARAAVHFLGQYSWLYALTLIPLAQLFALEFTSPLWVALLAGLFLGERITAVRLGAAALGFAGTLIVARPDALGLDPGVLLALLSAFGFGASMVCTKVLTRTDQPLIILFYMFLFQSALSLLLLAGGVRMLSLETLAWVAVLSLMGLSAHYCLVKAFGVADATVVAPMDFLRLPLIAIVGVLVYAEPLDPFVLIGGGVVVAANMLNIWGERRVRAGSA
jgi:drug/metabolite transporter (DMT)-like permease